MKNLIKPLLAACSIALATQAYAYDFTIVHPFNDELTINVDYGMSTGIILKDFAGKQIAINTCIDHYDSFANITTYKEKCSVTISGNNTRKVKYILVEINPDHTVAYAAHPNWGITLIHANKHQCVIDVYQRVKDGSSSNYNIGYRSENCPKFIQSPGFGSSEYWNDGHFVSFFNDENTYESHPFKGHPYIVDDKSF